MTVKFSKLWQKPPAYFWASLLCSTGGFIFGHDTGAVGAVTVMEQFTKPFRSPSPTMHGFIVSSILLSAAATSFFAGRVADTLGRQVAIAMGAAVFGVGAAIEAGSVHLGMFIAGRLVSGIGEGLYMGTLIVYICEVSPARHRGTLTGGPQLLVCCGIVVGFFTCYGTGNVQSSLSWRLPFALLALYAEIFAVAAMYLLPSSPRQLAARGRPQSEVTAAWEKLDVLPADQEIALGQLSAGDPATKYSWREVFSPGGRGRFAMAVFLLGMQQLCGIDGVYYYAPVLFQQAGVAKAGDTFLVSGISAIVIVVVSFPGLYYADSWSRRFNTIFGGLGMAITMTIIGGLYAGDAVHTYGPARWVVAVCIFLFAIFYCISWAIILKIYAAEIQPQRTRASATSIAHGANWVTNFTVALITPTLIANTGCGAYFLFGSCTFFTVFVCWLYMPETRGRTLNEIQDGFGSTTISQLKDSFQGVGGRFRKTSVQKEPAVVEKLPGSDETLA